MVELKPPSEVSRPSMTPVWLCAAPLALFGAYALTLALVYPVRRANIDDVLAKAAD